MGQAHSSQTYPPDSNDVTEVQLFPRTEGLFIAADSGTGSGSLSGAGRGFQVARIRDKASGMSPRQESTTTGRRSYIGSARAKVAVDRNGVPAFLMVAGMPERRFRKKQNDTWFTGLHNFGSTCYFNAVLVGLFACPIFRHVILSANLVPLPSSDFLVALQKLYEEMVETKAASLNPKALFSRLTRLQPEWTTKNQQDAHEFLNFVLNHIEDQLKLQEQQQARQPAPQRRHGMRRNASSRLSLRTARSSGNDMEMGSETHKNSKASVIESPNSDSRVTCLHSELPKLRLFPPPSAFPSFNRRVQSISSVGATSYVGRATVAPGGQHKGDLLSTPGPTSHGFDPGNLTAGDIVSVFEGSLAHNTRCLYCDHTSSRIEKYFDLPVDLSNSLEESIQKLETAEYLRPSEKYQCEKCCNMPQAAARSSELRHVPEILVIQLKRFKYDPARNILSKISAPCYVPLNLQLRTPVTEETYFRSCSLPEALAKIQSFISIADSSHQRSNSQRDCVSPLLLTPGAGLPARAVGDGELARSINGDITSNQRFCRIPGAVAEDAPGRGTAGKQHGLASSQSWSDYLQNEMDKSLTRLELTAVICHIGGSIFTGHYVTVARQSTIFDKQRTSRQIRQSSDVAPVIGEGEWCLIDDDTVTPLSQVQMERFFGVCAQTGYRTGVLKSQMGGLLDIRNAYLLFYTKVPVVAAAGRPSG